MKNKQKIYKVKANVKKDIISNGKCVVCGSRLYDVAEVRNNVVVLKGSKRVMSKALAARTYSDFLLEGLGYTLQIGSERK